VHLSDTERQLLPSGDVFDELSLFPSCALVARDAASQLNGSRAGAQVDKHDVVLRVGPPPEVTAGREEIQKGERASGNARDVDAGAKTTLRLVDVEDGDWGPGEEGAVTLAVWCRSKPCSKPEMLQVARARARPLSPAFLHYARSPALSGALPSAELVGALLLLHKCRSVDVFAALLPPAASHGRKPQVRWIVLPDKRRLCRVEGVAERRGCSAASSRKRCEF